MQADHGRFSELDRGVVCEEPQRMCVEFPDGERLSLEGPRQGKCRACNRAFADGADVLVDRQGDRAVYHRPCYQFLLDRSSPDPAVRKAARLLPASDSAALVSPPHSTQPDRMSSAGSGPVGGGDWRTDDDISIVGGWTRNKYWTPAPSERSGYTISARQGVPRETYQQAPEITRDEMAVYIARALCGGDANVPPGPDAPTFSDVPADHGAYRYVEYLVSRKVVTGYGGGGYQPTWKVTRAQMAVFIARSIVNPTGEAGLAAYRPPAAPTFRDVSPTHSAYRHIEFLKARGIVNGYMDGNYHPGITLTRDQTAVYVSRAFQLPL